MATKSDHKVTWINLLSKEPSINILASIIGSVTTSNKLITLSSTSAAPVLKIAPSDLNSALAEAEPFFNISLLFTGLPSKSNTAILICQSAEEVAAKPKFSALNLTFSSRTFVIYLVDKSNINSPL